ncbi:MAG: 30S ribosomal protein S20 [Deltaproteobacteria bacterium]|nr:30S ribosomal protein S20 [Deltaproteobacteria bacterium]
MANHKSAIKRARQSEDRRVRNKATRTQVKHVVKQLRQAVESQSSEAAAKQIHIAQSIIDRAAKKGVLHPKTAARKISRLTKTVNSL